MSYPYSRRITAGKYNPFQPKFTEHIVDGKETVTLLEAPPITRKPQGKLRSFMHAAEKLTPKLKKHDAVSLISVFGNHFDLNTHVASEEAEEYVRRFKDSLFLVKNLSPMGYYDDMGTDLASKVRKDTRPADLTYVLVEASISLCELNKTFVEKKPFAQ